MSTESGFLDTNGARIYYEVDGEGDPIVLVHAGIANLRMWDDQVAALRGEYRLIRYDTRGFGRTETDAVDFSNRADLAAVMDHLGVGAAHVVGASRGGQISLDFALERPDRVRSLTVAGGGVSGYEAPEETDASVFQQAERWWEAKDWDRLSEWETAYWVDGPGQPSSRVDPELRAKVHDWIASNYRAEKEEGRPQPLDPPAETRLDQLRLPLLVMVGTLDDPGTQGSMRHLAERVPGARLEVFEGAAHMLNLEQPERFTTLLREFLAGVPAPAR